MIPVFMQSECWTVGNLVTVPTVIFLQTTAECHRPLIAVELYRFLTVKRVNSFAILIA